jgi:hypothetical protein
MKKIFIWYGVLFLTVLLFIVSFVYDQCSLDEGFRGKGLRKAGRAVARKARRRTAGIPKRGGGSNRQKQRKKQKQKQKKKKNGKSKGDGTNDGEHEHEQYETPLELKSFRCEGVSINDSVLKCTDIIMDD